MHAVGTLDERNGTAHRIADRRQYLGVRAFFVGAEEGRAAAEIARLWAAIERSVKAIRGSVSANGAMHRQAA